MMSGTAGPGEMPEGTTAFTCSSPATSPGAEPWYVTGASAPPIVTVTGSNAGQHGDGNDEHGKIGQLANSTRRRREMGVHVLAVHTGISGRVAGCAENRHIRDVAKDRWIEIHREGANRGLTRGVGEHLDLRPSPRRGGLVGYLERQAGARARVRRGSDEDRDERKPGRS